MSIDEKINEALDIVEDIKNEEKKIIPRPSGDDEKEIDDSKPIASLSFGVSRDFCFKHRSQNFREALCLNHGDLLIMHPDCQKEWLHSVPTRKGITGQRINLTFRCYIRKK